MKITDIKEKCVFVHFAARMFSCEREMGKRDKEGAVVTSKRVEIISPSALKHLVNAKVLGERACRRYGSRFDMNGAWLVPTCNFSNLKTELKKSVDAFEKAKQEFINGLDGYINAQIVANPSDELAIRAAAPSAKRLEESIYIAWSRQIIVPDEEAYGVEREYNGVAEQAAWEIAQDVKQSTGTGTRYSRNTLDVLTRAADKADSFGFLSPSLAAIKPAVQQLRATVNIGEFTPADRLMIGAMIAWLSDHKKVINEGRHIDSVLVNTPFNNVTPMSIPAQESKAVYSVNADSKQSVATPMSIPMQEPEAAYSF